MFSGLIGRKIKSKARGKMIWGAVLIVAAFVLAYFMITDKSFSSPDTLIGNIIFFGLFDLAILIYGIRVFVVYVRTMNNIYCDPQVRKLSKYGPVERVLQDIENEFEAKVTADKSKKVVYFLESWIVVTVPIRIVFIRAADLLWAYCQKLTNRVNGMKTNEGFSLILRSKDRKIAVSGEEIDVYEALTKIKKSYPWVITGYDRKIDYEWKKNVEMYTGRAKKIRHELGIPDKNLWL